MLLQVLSAALTSAVIQPSFSLSGAAIGPPPPGSAHAVPQRPIPASPGSAHGAGAMPARGWLPAASRAGRLLEPTPDHHQDPPPVNATPEPNAAAASRRCARSLPPLLLPAALLAVAADPIQAGPVVCTTTLEAPRADAAPVMLSRCGPIQTVPELVQQRFYTYTAPFEERVNLSHQFTDLLGISLPGADGRKRMGFGFADQTIVYDGTALANITSFLLDAQSSPLPLRTPDLNGCLTTSLAGSSCASELR